MKERLSRPRAIKNFIDRIPFGGNHGSVLAAIAAGFDLTIDSPTLRYVLGVQQENFERLLLEIELAEIESDAKVSYKKQIKYLSRIVEYPILTQKPDLAKRDVVSPNYQALTYVSDALRIYADIDAQQKDDLSQLVKELQEYVEAVQVSQLDVRLRALIVSTLNNLVMLLQNYSTFGFDRASEVASAAMLTIYRTGPVADPEDRKLLRKIAAASVIAVGVLATIDAGLKHAGSIIDQTKSAYEFIEKSLEEYRPRLEYKVGEEKIKE